MSPDSDAVFHGWRGQVQELVLRRGKGGKQSVCLVGQADRQSAVTQGIVIWPAQKQVITWHPSTVDDPKSLADETNVIDTAKDVVASDAEVGTSTYLVTRKWLTDTERACRRYGVTVKVEGPEGRK
ncbi:hypothetical protein [Brytella acorum]|uniref:Uncharacterized protein n=1 Tax=Brytella acorum TaxID=2959299 RepID=A0AA35XWN9_9PROT|nr:hypothetical protein [Brytella acorum]MDF3625056.1 hypothetical protein [Brytella acorum]CAI9121066.1 hypothetical protein LMG32879_001911 [Brytella acorum]